MLISLINYPPNGCSYHRQLAPNGVLASKGIEVFQTNNLNAIDQKSSWEKWKVIQFNANDPQNQVNIARLKGLKVWFDLDDTWYLESQHPFFNQWKRTNRARITEKLIGEADVVTCANERLCELALKFNSNVNFLPNFLSNLEPQFQYKHHELLPDSPVVFGWVGAKQHLGDTRLLASSLDKLYCDRSLFNKYRVLYGGNVINHEGEVDPESERIGYYLKGNNSKYSGAHFGLMNATDHTRYAFMYQNIDVALAPLEDTNYNQYKSELKIIEAGYFGIPVIASDVYPYNTVIKHGVNGFLVKKEKDWLKYIKHFINNPQDIKVMGDNLKEYIDRRFNAEEITNKRIKILESLGCHIEALPTDV